MCLLETIMNDELFRVFFMNGYCIISDLNI